MITYFDTSTLIKLIVDEPGSVEAETIWDFANNPVTARITYVEARAALSAAKRNRRLASAQHQIAVAGLDLLWTQMSIVEITQSVTDRAVELTEEYGLRGYDAVHLACALIAGVEVFTSADGRLCDAARITGLHVADPLAEH